MAPFTNIVHPTDFSDTARNAMAFAAHIAKKTSGKLNLLHVYETPYMTVAESGAFAAKVDQGAHAKQHEQMRENIELLAKDPVLEGVSLSRQFVSDKPVYKFFEAVDEKYDLIVMGTQGFTGPLHGGIVGTNTERVIRFADMPVLSVPAKAEFHGINKIMLATNYDEQLEPFLPMVIDFAKLMGAKLHLVMINTRDSYSTTAYANERFAEIEKAFSYDNLQHHVYYDQSVEEGVMNAAKQFGVDLIAMHTHGRTGIGHLLYGSIAEDLSKYMNVPLLTFKNSK